MAVELSCTSTHMLKTKLEANTGETLPGLVGASQGPELHEDGDNLDDYALKEHTITLDDHELPSNTLSSITLATNQQLKLLASNYARAIEQANSNSKAKRVDALLSDWNARRDIEVQQFRQCAQMLERQLKEKHNSTQFYMGVTISEDSLIETKAKKGKPCYYRIMLGANQDEHKRGANAVAGGLSASFGGGASGAGSLTSSTSLTTPHSGTGLNASFATSTSSLSSSNWVYTTRLDIDTDGKIEVWISDTTPYFNRKSSSDAQQQAQMQGQGHRTGGGSSANSGGSGVGSMNEGGGRGTSSLATAGAMSLGGSQSGAINGVGSGAAGSSGAGMATGLGSGSSNQGLLSHFVTSSRHRTEVIPMRPAGPLYISIYPHSDLRALRIKVSIQPTLASSSSVSSNFGLSGAASARSRNPRTLNRTAPKSGAGVGGSGGTNLSNAGSASASTSFSDTHSRSRSSLAERSKSSYQKEDVDILAALLAEGVGGRGVVGSGSGASSGSGFVGSAAGTNNAGHGSSPHRLTGESGSAIHRNVARKLNLLRSNDALFAAFQNRVELLKTELKKQYLKKFQVHDELQPEMVLPVNQDLDLPHDTYMLPQSPRGSLSGRDGGKTTDSGVVPANGVAGQGERTSSPQQTHPPLVLPLYRTAPALAREWSRNRDPLSPDEMIQLRRAQAALERQRVAEAQKRAEFLLSTRREKIEQAAREREEYRERIAEERRQRAFQRLQSDWLTTITLVRTASWVMREAAALPHRRAAEAALSEYLARAEASRRGERARSHAQHLTSVVRFLAFGVALTRRDRAADIIRNFLEERVKLTNNTQDFLAQSIARFHRKFQTVRRCIARWVSCRLTKRILISLQWRKYEQENKAQLVRPVSEESLQMVLDEGLRQLYNELREYIVTYVRGRNIAGGLQTRPPLNPQVFMFVHNVPRLRYLLPKPLLAVWIARGHELDQKYERVQPAFVIEPPPASGVVSPPAPGTNAASAGHAPSSPAPALARLHSIARYNNSSAFQAGAAAAAGGSPGLSAVSSGAAGGGTGAPPRKSSLTMGQRKSFIKNHANASSSTNSSSNPSLNEIRLDVKE